MAHGDGFYDRNDAMDNLKWFDFLSPQVKLMLMLMAESPFWWFYKASYFQYALKRTSHRPSLKSIHSISPGYGDR